MKKALIFAVSLMLIAAVVASPATAEPGTEPEFAGASDPDGSVRAPGTSPAAFSHEGTLTSFLVQKAGHATAGRYLVDIEVRWDGTQERYTAVWFPVSGTIHTLIQGTSTEWTAFINSMRLLAGRWLDVEVGYFGGVKKYSAIYYQDGDDYNCAVYSNNTDAGFQVRLDQMQREGRSIIDFEAYTEPGGTTRFAGVWAADPNQPPTHLLYNLEAADVSTLFRPMQGRVIDVERYYSDLHGENRFAMILAVLPGGGWGHYREKTWTEVLDLNDTISDGDTHLIDLDPVITKTGAVEFNVVWGNDYKSLNEVPAMPAPLDSEPLTAELSDLVTEFETTLGVGTVGFYAKNLRTNQSIGYRENEMSYLASATKTAIHIKFWQDAQNHRFYPSDALAFSNSENTGDPWYVDERSNPGFASGAPGFENNLGRSYALDRYDLAMMTRSDNAAASALVLDPTYGAAYAAQDLTEWLASETGIGRGWGIVTAIQDVDRILAWESQQNATRAGDKSYFQLPRFALEPLVREQYRVCTVGGELPTNCVDAPGCTRCWDYDWDCLPERCWPHPDPWGELADFFGVASGEDAPEFNDDDGYPRYYATGLNAATPRAVGNLWEGLVEGRFLNTGYTENALNSLGDWTPMDDGADFPGSISSLAKGGSREGTCVETGVFRYGSENIVYSVQTKDLTRPCQRESVDDDVRDIYMPAFGEEIVFALATDLEVVNPATDAAIGPSVVRPGEDLIFFATVTNKYGGDADPVNVRFVLSATDYIHTGDSLIGTGRTSLIPGNGSEMVLETGTMPGLSPGMYYLGWFVDYDNEVPEVDEYNKGFSPVQIQVQAPLVEITDLRFIAEKVAEWTATVDTANYRLYEGTSSTLPLLRDMSLDSCQFDSVTSPISSDFARVPPPGGFYWYLVQAENDGPIMPSSSGPRSLDSIGWCGTSCGHSKCEVGDVVDPVCDTCVAAICEFDSYCCETTWDSLCVQHVRTVCNSLACSESAGTCDHTVCAEGGVLVPGCDDPPVSPSCVEAICDHDPYCCATAWDNVCIGQVDNYCGATCE